MAGTKISDLPSAGALTGAELVPVVQSDVTKKTTVSDILTSAGAGTVTSVDVSGGTTGLTATGGPITTTGTITLGGTLDVDNGGTGATTASGARSNLGAAASGANSDITSLTGVTGGISTPDFIQYDTAAGATTAVGKEYWSLVSPPKPLPITAKALSSRKARSRALARRGSQTVRCCGYRLR